MLRPTFQPVKKKIRKEKGKLKKSFTSYSYTRRYFLINIVIKEQ